MIKIRLISFFIFFLSISLSAQKAIQKEYAAEDVQTLSIVDDALFKITVHSTTEKNIQLSAHISGEHAEEVIIAENLSGKTLSLKTGYTPFLVLENDKLAAHKVMAIEIELVVPSTISIEITSKLAAVTAVGHFKDLSVSIENANCHLLRFSGNAHIKTKDGNILVLAENMVSGTAFSENGTAENTLGKHEKYTVVAESVNGTIKLLQTK